MRVEYFYATNRKLIVHKKKCGYFITINDVTGENSLTLLPKLWLKLMSLQSRIDEELTKDDANLHEELGHKIYVSVKTPYRCVHIRRYYKKWSPATCTSSMFPTRDGITFKRRDWDQVESVALLLA